MRTMLLLAVVSLFLTTTKIVFAQSGNASVGGFVQDASQAFIPGVTVTATNTQTGVATSAVTNESGTYNISGLLPGIYKLTAELPGFKTQAFTAVTLGQGVSSRYNFTLEVGAVADSVEVTAEAAALIAESSPTIGQVLGQDTVRDLPLVTNNVLDLMQTMAGVRGATLGESTTFAGISTSMVNTVRDGLSVQDGRYANGVNATTQVHPDMVGEFRVILTPVDAELGRGNGQVQILTRSGTNEFHGSGAWYLRNSALDANTWRNNKQVVNGEWKPGESTWINRNQLTGSLGGPIVKNKTFFFTLFDKQFERQRQTVRPVVLTDCARNGIFRYWEGWGNGDTLTPTTTTGVATRPSVDSFGNPVRPDKNPNGTPYTGQLRYFSVFGPVMNTPVRPDCSDAIVGNSAWDSNRTRMDPAGISQKYLEMMPLPNIFDGGDGLNTAVYQWVRRGHNNGNFGLANGQNTDTDRRQINTKIDHSFNARHKVAANYSYEWIDGDYLPSINVWPDGFTSEVIRRPKVLTVNFTSTLTQTLLNEARFGYRANKHIIWAPWEVTDPEARKIPESFLLQGGQGFPIAYVPAAVGGVSANNFSCITNCAQQGNTTPLYNYADTISWTRSKHAFRGGVDIRYTYTSGAETPTAPIPKATGGAGLNANQTFRNNAAIPGLITTNETTANSLLYFLAGSINNVQQYYFLQQSNDLTKWDNYASVPTHRKITEPHQNDFSLFFKDDWKVNPSLTLNLGVRYEYYGVPYEGNGLTVVPVGGGSALFGVSGRSFDRWLRPDNPVDLNLLTQVEFVGPKTKQPNKSIYKKDWNNFGPAVGFAWQLPWFGKGKTNVRGGYQISYAGSGRLGNYSNSLFSNPGFLHLATTQGPTDGTYFDAQSLSSAVPIAPAVLPMQPVPLLKMSQSINAFDYNFKTPYIQNYTLSVTRDITRNLNLDVRYVATRGIGLLGIINLNVPNVFYNPALFDALEKTRRGEDVALFDQMFMGLNLNPNVRGCDPSNPTALCGPVNTTTQRGSQHLRLSSTFRTDLANGNFTGIANALNTYNGTGSGASGAVPGIAGEQGNVLRRANKGFNVPGGTTIAGGPVVPAGLFPENWINTNPQFNQTRFWSNTAKSNYHSMQAQATLRPTQGLSLQGTYVWSRALEVPGVGFSGGLTSTDPAYTNPAERDKDYALAPNHVTHDFRSFGVFELPIGPGKALMRNSSGLAARLVEGWQASFIVNLSTGQPGSIAAANMLYASGVADIVGPFTSAGKVEWNGQFGNFFGSNTLSKIPDPQCASVASELRQYCTLQAVVDTKAGRTVLQNPQPGRRGTLGRQTIELPGSWDFDAAMSKTVRLTESKRLQVRLDATNILNHPVPSNPTLNINSDNAFGLIEDKGDQRRQFKAQLRFTF